jgi:AcrR family transcriptional regulator
MSATKRDQLVETALSIFEREGFRAAGIDRILAEAGVAKMTLYKHFSSKDELAAAAIRLKDARFRGWLVDRVEQRAASPRDRLAAFVAVVQEAVHQPVFPGCLFARAAAEYREIDHPVHAAAAANKRLVRQYVQTLAAAAGAAEPGRLAWQLTALVDGAMVNQVIGGGAPALPAAIEAAAGVLIDAALD